MTGDAFIFSHLSYENRGKVTFKNNASRKMMGNGTIGKDNTIINNVLLVKG